jgi:hypothetical protein
VEIGQRWQAVANFLGRPAHITLRLAQLQRPALVGFALEGEPAASLTVAMQPGNGSSTNVWLTLDVPSVPGFLLVGLMGGLLSADLERLRALMEEDQVR